MCAPQTAFPFFCSMRGTVLWRLFTRVGAGLPAEIVRVRHPQNVYRVWIGAGRHLAAIGPCIRECCYEVGAEVAAQFIRCFPGMELNQSRKPSGKRKLNLAEANMRQMQAAGVPRGADFRFLFMYGVSD